MSRPLKTIALGAFSGLNDSRNPYALESSEATRADNVEFVGGALSKIQGTLRLGNVTVGDTTVWSPGYDFVTRAGVRKHIRIVKKTGGTAMQYLVAGVWTTLGAGTEFQDALASFVTWPDYDALFTAQTAGSASLKKLIGTTLTGFGIPAPAAAPTLNSNINGALTVGSTPSYKITYYSDPLSGGTGEKGNPSAALTIPAVPADPTDGARINIPADGTFDANIATHAQVWRLVAADGVYHLDGSVAYTGLATTYDSILADATVALADSLETDNDVAPAMKVIIPHKRRIWGIPFTNPHLPRFSKLNHPEQWPPDNTVNTNPPSTGGAPGLIGILPYRTQLYFFSNEQMFILRGSAESGRDAFALETLPHGVGCVSHQTIATWDEAVMWWSKSGLVRWNGSGFEFPLQKQLSEFLKWTSESTTDWTNAGSPLAIEPSRLGNMASALVRVRGRIEYHLTFTPRGETTNRKILVVDLGTWSVHFRDIAAASLGAVEDSSGAEILYAGTYDGKVLECDRGSSFDGSAIPAVWRSAWIHSADKGARMPLRGALVRIRTIDSSLAAHSVTVRYYLDYSTTPSGDPVAIALPTNVPVLVPMVGDCHSVQLQIENLNASEDFVVDGIEILYRDGSVVRERIPAGRA